MRARYIVLALFLPCLAGAVWQWVREKPPPWPLHTTLSPELLELAKAWPASTWSDTVAWGDEAELLVERREIKQEGPYVAHQWIRVRFAPPGVPRVDVDEWTDSTADAEWIRCFIDVYSGEAWISSNGQGLGIPGGPALAVRWVIQGTDNVGSLEYTEDTLLLTSEQLRRK